MLIQRSSGSDVTLCARYVALLVDRPGATEAITKLLKIIRRLPQSEPSAWVVPANLDYFG